MKRQREQDEEGEDRRCAAILFLAHNGVANPDLWVQWRESQPEYASRIKFYVFRNATVQYASDFADVFDLKIRMKTMWCHSSIVKANITSMARILQADPDIAIIYTVSGEDIPVQRPEALFLSRHVVTEGVATKIRPFTTVMGYNPEEAGTFQECPEWAKADDDVRRNVTCHVQWCGLSREHAILVTRFPQLNRLYTIADKLADYWCPDEWVIGTILRICKVNPMTTIDWTMTDQYRLRSRDQSPILWRDLQVTKKRVFWAPPSSHRTFDLLTLLNEVTVQEGNLFFRKVGPLTAEEVNILFQRINTAAISGITSRAVEELLRKKQAVQLARARLRSKDGDSHEMIVV